MVHGHNQHGSDGKNAESAVMIRKIRVPVRAVASKMAHCRIGERHNRTHVACAGKPEAER